MVYILLVNVGNWFDTIECISSLLKLTTRNIKIIIIENTKIPNDFENIKSYLIKKDLKFLNFSDDQINDLYTRRNSNIEISKPICSHKFIIIRNEKVAGFSTNNNLGIKYTILCNDFEYIWILNNDTVVLKNTLENLINYFNEIKIAKVGIVGSLLLFYSNCTKIQALGGGKNFSWLGGIKSFMKGKNRQIVYSLDQEAIMNKINMLSGASWLIKREVIEQVGLLDERYFMYGEDLDYSTRVLKGGFKLGIAKNSIILHKHNSVTKKKSKEFYYYHNSRSFTIYLRKHENILILFSGLFFMGFNSFRKYPTISCLWSYLKGVNSGFRVDLS